MQKKESSSNFTIDNKMHESSMLRMQWFREKYLNNLDEKKVVTVLDVGSQCVEGQPDTYKKFFTEPHFKYIGLDMVDGYNVDIVVKNAYQWNEIPDNYCDVIISGQMFEHVEFPWFTIQEMARVLKPKGLICIIVPSMQGLHRYPVNCQNYFSDGLIALAKYAGLEPLHASTNCAPKGAGFAWYNEGIQDSMLVAQKPLEWKQQNFDIANYVFEVADLGKMSTELIPIEEQEWYVKHRWIMRIQKAFPLCYYVYKKIKMRTRQNRQTKSSR